LKEILQASKPGDNNAGRFILGSYIKIAVQLNRLERENQILRLRGPKVSRREKDNAERGHGQRSSEMLVSKRMADSAKTFVADMATDYRIAHAELNDEHPGQAGLHRKT
jgi:hypothetical protein